VEVPFFRASGRLAEHMGLRAVYLSGIAVYVLMLVAWALLASPVAVALIRVLGGVGFGLTYAALVVITGRLVPERLRTTGQALMQVATVGLGPVLGAAVGGVVYRRLGASTLFGSAAAVATFGAAVIWWALSGPAASVNRSGSASGSASASEG
jgi:PPP family 3-phenylpropionic acid transporter